MLKTPPESCSDENIQLVKGDQEVIFKGGSSGVFKRFRKCVSRWERTDRLNAGVTAIVCARLGH